MRSARRKFSQIANVVAQVERGKVPDYGIADAVVVEIDFSALFILFRALRLRDGNRNRTKDCSNRSMYLSTVRGSAPISCATSL